MNRYDENHEAFVQCVGYVEEVFVYLRKGVAQTRYIGMVDESAEYFDDKGNTITVPQEIVGYWMMGDSSNLQYTPFSEALRSEYWVKCVRKEIVSYGYEELQ